MNKKLSVFLGLILFLLSIASIQALITDNLTAYYSFDTIDTTGTAIHDLSGYNNASNFGATASAGVLNNSLYCVEGESDYITANTTATALSTTFSVNYWMKYSGSATSQEISIAYANTTGASSARWQLNTANGGGSAGKYEFYYSLSPYRTYTNNDQKVNNGVWQMYTLVRNGATTTIYQNGSAISTSNNIPTGDVNTGDKFWACRHSGGDYTTMYIDEYSFFERALSTDDITALWNGGLGFNPLAPVYYNYSINVQVNYNGVGVNAAKVQFTNNNTNVSIFNVTNSSGGLSQPIGFNTVAPVPNIYYIVTAWINGNNTVRPVSNIVYVSDTN